MHSTVISLSRSSSVALHVEVQRYDDGNETGGILLGHDRNSTIDVTVAGDPGPSAHRSPTRFSRDLDHSRRLGDVAFEEDGSVWIGEWHTHPGGPTKPSLTDMDTYCTLLADVELSFKRFVSLIITPCPSSGWRSPRAHGWIITPRAASVVTLEAVHVEINPARSSP